MEDISTRISRLKRPKLLVRTARHALEDYDRCMHLRRLLKTERLPSPGRALMQLLELEGVMNDQRIAGRAEYSVARHVEVLAAIMSESQAHRALASSRRQVLDLVH